MPIKVNGTTSGSVTLAAPASGSDVTLTLPGSTGTVAVVGSAAMTLITSGTLSGASVTLSNIPATYKDLRLIVRNLLPATDAAYLMYRFNNDSTSSRYDAFTLIGASGRSFNSAAMGIGASADNAVATGGLLSATVFDYANSSTWKFIQQTQLTNNATTSTSYNLEFSHGVYNQAVAINAITLLMSSGNLTSGDYLLYGIG